jgi:hypothetical protein
MKKLWSMCCENVHEKRNTKVRSCCKMELSCRKDVDCVDVSVQHWSSSPPPMGT